MAADKETSPEALKARYISILRDNNITQNFTDIDVVVPPLLGDHFTSSCDYLTIHQENGEKLELFTKRIVENHEYSKMMREARVFEKEAGFFNRLVPMLNKFIESIEKSGVYKLDMLPKSFFANEEMVIMENLGKKNYTLLDKNPRQDLTEIGMYVKTLAKYHAPSYLMLKEEKSIEDFNAKNSDILFEALDTKSIADCLAFEFAVIVEILQLDSSPEGRQALELAKELKTNVFKRLLEPLKLEHGHVAFVLNHGDTRTANMLFRPNPATKQLDHLVLIDFQHYRTSSPNMDLLYYMYFSVAPEVRRTEWKNFLKLYYNELTANVSVLKGNVDFSFEELVVDFKRKLQFGFIMGVAMMVADRALSNIGELDKDQGEILGQVADSVVKWAQEDPERTKRVTRELINWFQEYKELSS